MEGGRTYETIQLEIKETRHLRGIKCDNVTTYAKLEFDGRVIGETNKVEANANTTAVYNYTCHLDCWFIDDINARVTIEDLASKPVIITFVEVLPKEKKQKEEKVVLLGQCSVDFFALLRDGRTHLDRTLLIHPIMAGEVKPAASSAATPNDRNASVSQTGTTHEDVEAKPEVDISLSVNQLLLDEELQKSTNLMTIRVGSAYSLPDAFTGGTGSYNYMVGLPLPHSGGKDGFVLFQNGTFKPAIDKELKRRMMKWHNVTTTASGAQFIPSQFFEKPSPMEEKGDFPEKSHGGFRMEAENEKGRVTWDTEKRSYLDPETKSVFRALVQNKRLLPVEFLRISGPPTGKATGAGGKKQLQVEEESGQVSYHGVCYVDLGPLLYPGVKSIYGAFKVHPYSESEIERKTLRKPTMMEEVARVQNSGVRGSNVSPHRGKGQSTKRMPTVVKNQESTGDVSEYSTPGTSPESAVYAESKTYVVLEISLAQPLLPQRQQEELITMVSQTIPPRPITKIQVGGADKAVSDYHAQLTSVAHMVLDEFRSLYGKDIMKGELDLGTEEQIKRKKRLYYELNTSGKYFAYKEQMKHSIVKIVREKFMKTSAFTTPEDLQQFLSELYVYLIDEMHVCIGKFLSVNEKNPAIKTPEISCSQLKRFAEEAFDQRNYQHARQYYQERIAKSERNSACWLEYGIFHLHVGNNIKAKECFKESVAIDQNYVPGLLLYGIVSTLDTNFDEAEVMFERAVSLSFHSDLPPFLPATVIGIFYEFVDNQFRLEHAFLQAARIVAMQPMPTGVKDEKKKSNISSGETSPKRADLEQPELERKAIWKSNSNLSMNPKAKENKALNTAAAATNKLTADRQVNTDKNIDASKCCGNTDGGDKNNEKECSKKVPHSIYLQTADWLIECHALNFAESLLARELLSAKDGPTVDYYILLARLLMKQKNYQQANETINKAIALEIENPEAWAISGHIAYEEGRTSFMQDCYERTIAFVNDARNMHTILLRLAQTYMESSKYAQAKRIYLMASKYSFTCLTWLGVGMSCYRLGELEEAEDALAEANVLNNTNPTVWSYLALVTLKTNRQLEAEQCYKYATKLGLSDQKLINEVSQLQRQVGFGNPSF